MFITEGMIYHWNELCAGHYYWCKKCHRVYATSQWRVYVWRCPSQNCDGDLLSVVSWTMIRRKHDVPEDPDVGRKYEINWIPEEDIHAT